MSIQATIEDKLNKAFSPERLVILNESHLHAGHHHVMAATMQHSTARAKPISASVSSHPPLPA
jgi:stress-induced morphogen